MPLTVGAVVAGVGGLGKTITGLFQNSNANKLKNNLVRPTYNIQDQYYTDQNLAEQQAEGGLSEASKDYYGGQADRGLTAGIAATLAGGGDVNSIGSLYDKYNQGNMAIAAKDSELQNDNIRYLIDRNKDLASEETKAWALNKYEPYKDAAQAATAEKNAAQQNIWGGVGEIGSAITSMYKPQYEDKSTTNGPDPNSLIATPSTPNPGFNIPYPTGPTNPFGSNPVVPRSDLDTASRYGSTSALGDYRNSPYYDALQSYFNKI